MMTYADYFRRKRMLTNKLAIALATLITILGVALPFWILFTVVDRGMSSFNWSLFTQMTPPPDSEGGLLNAIVGSLMMVGLAIVIASPIGVLTGIYLSEYGRCVVFARILLHVCNPGAQNTLGSVRINLQ
jgi:phosphate transport system permease protein